MKNSFQVKAADVFVTCGDFTASVCRLRNTSAVSIDYKVGEVTTVLAAGAASGAINVSNSTREVSVRRSDLNSSAVSVLIEWGLTADEAYELASSGGGSVSAHNTAPDAHADIRAALAGKQDAGNFAGSSTPGGAATTALECTGNSATATTASSCSGNAATATALETARTLTIGSKANTFDGSANVAWTLSEMGADPAGTADAAVSTHNAATDAHADIRTALAGKQDAGNFAGSSTPGGAATTALECTGNSATATTASSCSGNAATATALETARTLTIGSKANTFDGSANVSWTLAEMGADPAGTADAAVSAHNTAPDAHADIRTLVAGKQDSLTISTVGTALLNLSTPTAEKIPRVNADGSVVLIDAPRWYASDDGPPNLSLSWVSNGDANGVVYLAGSTLGGGSFINPSISGGPLAMLRSSDEVGNASQLTDRAPNNSYSANIPNSWICCDLGVYYALGLKSYSLRHQALYDVDYIRTWRIQGSNEVTWSKAGVEAAEWVDLDVRSNDTTISTLSGWGHFSLPEQAPSYRYIRLIQDGLNSTDRHYLTVVEWEFYGTLTTTPRPAGSAGWARNSKLIDDATAWMPYYAAAALTDGTPI